MRKLASIILAVSIALCFPACSNSGSNQSTDKSAIKIGDYVEFGDYNWQVLDIQKGKALVISERVLEQRPYHNTPVDITWADCDLRAYLNNDFYNSFDKNDRSNIVTVKNKNPDNPWDFSENGGKAFTDGGVDTKDNIFLLSLDEIIKYFCNDDKNSMLYESYLGKTEQDFTDGFSDARIAYLLSGYFSAGNIKGATWLLRSPGMYTDTVAYIGSKGSIVVSGYYVEYEDNGIRPAMWLKNVNDLKKSVVLYSGENSGAADISGYHEEVADNDINVRLYHDWNTNWSAEDNQKLEEVNKLQEDYCNEWINFSLLLEESRKYADDKTNKIRQSVIVGDEVHFKLQKKITEESSNKYLFYSWTIKEIDDQIIEYKNKMSLLIQVEDVLQKTIDEVNASAVSVDEMSLNFLSAIATEITRYAVKDFASDTNETLWNDGYYHAIFGNDVLAGITYEEFDQMSQDKIDEKFGENRIFEILYDDEAILDNYFEAVFFSDN